MQHVHYEGRAWNVDAITGGNRGCFKQENTGSKRGSWGASHSRVNCFTWRRERNNDGGGASPLPRPRIRTRKQLSRVYASDSTLSPRHPRVFSGHTRPPIRIIASRLEIQTIPPPTIEILPGSLHVHSPLLLPFRGKCNLVFRQFVPRRFRLAEIQFYIMAKSRARL